MGRIYDEKAIEVGHTQKFSVGEIQLNVNRAPGGDWLVDAGGTDAVTIREVDGSFVVDPSGTATECSAFPSAMQIAMRRLGL